MLLLLFSGPVVQVVSDVVALAAFREAVMHRLCMGQPVAIGAIGHGLVLGGVAGCAGDLAVLRLACGQRCKDRIVARGTELRSGAGRVSQRQRLVCLVTGCAVSLGNGLGVR